MRLSSSRASGAQWAAAQAMPRKEAVLPREQGAVEDAVGVWRDSGAQPMVAP
jgi:hypothetical protein